MNIDNGVISERQAFRIALLENITVGMVLIPYITTSIAGKKHLWLFLAGIILISLYGVLVYGYSRLFSKGLADAIDESFGWFSKVLLLIYVLRYVLRAGIVLLFFADVVRQYMLRNMNVWVIAVPFILVCGYGAMRDIEGRGRLLELLFWWMLVPLILVAVFSITNVSWNALSDEMFSSISSSDGDIMKIIYGGYIVLISTSGMELMTFTLAKQKENNWKNALKMLIWIIIALVLAYTFVIGILGSNWTGADDKAALNVMEASAFPGGLVERMDYPVLAFWIIGIFAVISGYIFYARVFAKKVCQKGVWWQILIIVAAILLVMGGLMVRGIRDVIVFYIIWIDFAVSVIVPLIVLLVRRVRIGSFILLLCVTISCTGCQNKYESASLENRDYATKIDIAINDNQAYVFEFTIADLTEYNGASEGLLDTNVYICASTGLENAMQMYYDENNRQLDIGHVKSIKIYSEDKERLYEFAREISEMPMIAKSVSVSLNESQGGCREILLRELIKEAYTWE